MKHKSIFYQSFQWNVMRLEVLPLIQNTYFLALLSKSFWGFVTWYVKWALTLTHRKIMLNIYFQKSMYSDFIKYFHRAAKDINEKYMERLKEYFLYMVLYTSLNFSNRSRIISALQDQMHIWSKLVQCH